MDMEKVLQELFGRIFLGAYTVQTVPKCIWMWHCSESLVEKNYIVY